MFIFGGKFRFEKININIFATPIDYGGIDIDFIDWPKSSTVT